MDGRTRTKMAGKLRRAKNSQEVIEIYNRLHPESTSHIKRKII